MLHILYVIAFTAIAFLAIGNLIRSLITLSMDYQRPYSSARKSSLATAQFAVPHPELLDENGNPTSEPLLVMRSMTVEDAREKLDALYRSSPGNSIDQPEEI